VRLDKRALDAAPFTAEQLAALQAAIDVNDIVDPEITLPGRATRAYAQDQLIAAFRLARQLWREGFDPAVLRAITGRLRSGQTIDVLDQRRLKNIRAKCKHLRFAFVLYAADHRCPPVLKALTTAMGHLQDGMKQDPPRTARPVRLLAPLLTRPSLALITRSVDRLTASDSAGYDRFVAAQMASLQSLLASPDLTVAEFHSARKIVSRQVSFHDDFRVLFPAGEHVVMSRYLSAINGLMGQQHDQLVADHARGALHKRGSVRLSADLRHRLLGLLDLYR
jgi:hypothetical protein